MNKRLKILILEDNAEDVEIIERLLKKEGPSYDFQAVMHKEEFILALDGFTPDLIISDNNLPQFSAKEALEIVNQRFIDIPFILVTGTTSEEFAVNIIKQGADDYILKDRLTRLPAAIEAALQKRKAEKELNDYKYALDEAAIISITNESGVIIYVNQNFCEISQYTKSELLGQRYQILSSGYHPIAYIKKLWKTISRGKIWKGEFLNKSKGGNFYWIEATIVPFLDLKGVPYQYLSIQTNISERKNAELEMKSSETRYRRLFESAKDGILILDAAKGIIVDVNPFLEKLLGYSKEEFLNKQLWEIGLFKDILSNKEAFLRLIKGKYIRYDNLPLRSLDGRTIWVEFISNCYKVNGTEVVQCNIRDVTDRKESKEILLATNKELRALAFHLQSVREEERINIAREIHDELGQQLTGLKMDVYSLNKNLAGKDEKTTVKITEILELTDEIVKSVRRITANLRPTILDDLGLIAALEWQSQEVEKRSEIKVKFESHLEKVVLPADLATSVFRIYQEALNNAVKHSNANHIFSKFSVKNNRLTLLIRDDGNGMIDHNDQKKTYGLMGIKERVYIFNGRFEITGKAGKGTKITITIPLQ